MHCLNRMSDIDIEVRIGPQLHKLTVSNSTSVMALKVQMCDVMRCSVAPERLEVRLGDVILEDPIPLHFYGVQRGTKLSVIKPYIGVTIENNHGTEIFWRLDRMDTIKEATTKLATIHFSNKMRFNLYKHSLGTHGITRRVTADAPSFTEIIGFQEAGESAEGMRLYLITEDGNFNELDNNKNC